MQKLINFLQSKNSVALFLLLSLASMIVHTAMVYYIEDGKHWYDIIFSLSFSIAFDIAVIYFVLRGNQWIPYFLSACQIYMNYIHYDQQNAKVSNAALFLSFVLPFIIAAFSHDIYKRNKEEKEIEKEVDKFRREKELVEEKYNTTLSRISYEVTELQINTAGRLDDIEKESKELGKELDKTANYFYEREHEYYNLIQELKTPINKCITTLNNISEIAQEKNKSLFITSKEDIL